MHVWSNLCTFLNSNCIKEPPVHNETTVQVVRNGSEDSTSPVTPPRPSNPNRMSVDINVNLPHSSSLQDMDKNQKKSVPTRRPRLVTHWGEGKMGSSSSDASSVSDNEQPLQPIGQDKNEPPRRDGGHHESDKDHESVTSKNYLEFGPL